MGEYSKYPVAWLREELALREAEISCVQDRLRVLTQRKQNVLAELELRCEKP